MLARRMADTPPFSRLRLEVDRLFERFFGDYEHRSALAPSRLRSFPAVNVWQDDDNVFMEAELPGLTENDIDVTVAGNELTIKGDRNFDPKEDVTVHRRGRGVGAFSRVVHLPMEVNDDQVEATFSNGVLTVTLAKAEVARSHRIPVKALDV